MPRRVTIIRGLPIQAASASATHSPTVSRTSSAGFLIR
jgi:hypothetical protein